MKTCVNRSRRVYAIAMVMAFVMAFSLAACGSSTLQDSITGNDLQELANSAAVDGTTVKANVNKNDITLDYQLDSVDSPLLDSFISGYYGEIDWDAVYAAMEGNTQSAIAQLQKETGVDGIACTVLFRDSSGRLLSQHTFTE